jgi:hypothetical protein
MGRLIRFGYLQWFAADFHRRELRREEKNENFVLS